MEDFPKLNVIQMTIINALDDLFGGGGSCSQTLGKS